MASRDYQVEQINSAVELVSAKRKIVVQLPTGGGKTYEFALLTQRFVRNQIESTLEGHQSVLIVVDRIELLNQAATTIKNLTGIDPSLITSDTKQFRVARVYIAMVESLVNRLHLIHNVGLVIIDECHVANFNKLHKTFLEELVIGYTATPISSSKKDPLNNYYNDIVVGPQISKLIVDGFLSQNITRVPSDRVDPTKLAIDKMTGDYNEGQMSTVYSSQKHILNAVAQYHKYCEGKKTMVYNVGIEHSKQVCKVFQLMGYNVKHLDATDNKTPANDPIRFKNLREETIQWFKETEDAILCNVGLFTRGFDEPTIERIIINFSTLSLPKWLQCCGRGGRIIDQEFIDKFQKDYPYTLKLKKTFEIIDLGGNAVSGLGDWSDDRDWYNIFHNPEMPGNGLAPTKVCPNCEGLVHAAVRICPLRINDDELCNYEFEKKKQGPEKEMTMVAITKNAATAGIDIKKLVEKYKKKYPLFTFYKMGEEVVDNVFNNIKDPSQTVLLEAFEEYYKLCIEWADQTLYENITYNDYYIKRARNNFDKLVNDKKMALIKARVETAEINHYPYTCDHCSDQVEAVNREGICLNCENQLTMEILHR